MEKIKIFYRGTVVWNTALFILMSAGFLFLQDTFYNLSSVLEKETVISFVRTHKLSLILNLVTLLLVWRLSKIAKFFFLLVLLNTFVVTCVNLEAEFSKIIMMITFFYLVIAIFMYQFLNMELLESYYNPRFSDRLWHTPMLLKIEASLSNLDNTVSYLGYLTNWSEAGGFIKLNEPQLLKDKITLVLKFEGKHFQDKVTIVSAIPNNGGYGFKVIKQQDRENTNHLGWDEFYEIMNQMGFLPELLT